MRITKFVEGEFYHIYNRGNSRQEIFLDDEDCKRFQRLLYVCNGEKNFHFRDDILAQKVDPFTFPKGENLVEICAYVLMPNHFHLYIYIPRRPTSGRKVLGLSDFMKKITGAYSKYFNAKYERSGGLFEGRFKAEHITNDQYFKYLFSYIAMNPLKLLKSNWQDVGFSNIEKAGSFLNDYKHSSFIDYFVDPERPEAIILSKQIFLNNLPEKVNLEEEILEWMKYTKDSKHS